MKGRHLLTGGGVAIASAWLGQACQSQEPATVLPEESEPAIAVASSFPVTMAGLAIVFLRVLGPELRDRVVFPFESEERFNWHYTPRSRQGISLKNMNRKQQQAAKSLLQFALSETGYRKVRDILKLETVLRQQGGSPSIRDPELYFWTVFGEPGRIPWGWRVEGHHLSLNIAVVSDNIVEATPAFWGANPAEVPIPPHQGLRALAREQDLAFELLQSLSPEQQERVLIRDRSFGDIVAGPGRSASLLDVVGLPLGEIEAAGRDRALQLLGTYVENLQPDLAEQQLQRIRDAGIDKIRFAWAGALDKERGHYYRLHGPAAIVEFDNTRNNANHIHSVWHDLTREFGVDALRSHYEHFPHI